MYYEINVAKKEKRQGSQEEQYVHFFATAPRSITSKWRLKAVYTELKQAFPMPLYNISMSYHPDSSESIDPEELDKE